QSARTQMTHRLRHVLQIAAFAAAYFAAARVGLLAAVAQPVVSSAWPPSGLALAALLLLGLRLWPGIALGTFLLNWTAGVSAVGAAGIATGNTLEAVAAAWLLTRVVDFRPSLERVRDVIALVVVGALASTTLSATLGVASLWASGAVAPDALRRLWSVWWSGDALGDVLVAPLLLTWVSAGRTAGRRLEAAGVLAAVVTERGAAERALEREVAFVRLLQDVAVAANQAQTAEHALQSSVTEVCRVSGWPVGHVYEVSPDDPDLLRPSRIWHDAGAPRHDAFRRATEQTTLRRGVGLPGRVLATGQPTWIVDVTQDANFPRGDAAAEAGLRAGLAFPVTVGAEVAAVLEFFSPDAVPPNAALRDLLAHIGSPLGRLIERQRAP